MVVKFQGEVDFKWFQIFSLGISTYPLAISLCLQKSVHGILGICWMKEDEGEGGQKGGFEFPRPGQNYCWQLSMLFQPHCLWHILSGL